jgi:hypothetical protein
VIVEIFLFLVLSNLTSVSHISPSPNIYFSVNIFAQSGSKKQPYFVHHHCVSSSSHSHTIKTLLISTYFLLKIIIHLLAVVSCRFTTFVFAGDSRSSVQCKLSVIPHDTKHWKNPNNTNISFDKNNFGGQIFGEIAFEKD